MKRVSFFAVTSFAVAVLALFEASPARAADPDWDQINKSAVDLLQRYVRIESIDPRRIPRRPPISSSIFSKRTVLKRSFTRAVPMDRPIWWRASPAAITRKNRCCS